MNSNNNNNNNNNSRGKRMKGNQAMNVNLNSVENMFLKVCADPLDCW